MFNHVTLLLDMGGCLKKCPMCHHIISSKNNMLLDDLHLIYELFTSFSKSITISSWYKDVDILSNYKELYSVEQKISDNIYENRFNKINYYRLINDKKYLSFIHKLNLKEVSIDIYGNHHTHNRYVGINKDFENIIESIKLLTEQNIKVKLNYIVSKLNINELKKTYDLFKNYNVEFTISQNIPTNLAFKKIYNRLTKQDLPKINFMNHNLGKTESDLYNELIKDQSFLKINTLDPTFIIDGKKNIYHKINNLDSLYYLGNIKTESIKQIVENYLSMNTRLLNLINKYSIKDICLLAGNKDGSWIFTKEEYIIYLLELLLNDPKFQNTI